MDLGSQSALVVEAPVVQAVEDIWADLRVDDGRLRDVAVQDEIARQCASRIGSRWDRLVAEVRTTMSEPPHWLLFRSSTGRPSLALFAALSIVVGVLQDPYRTSWSRVLQEIRHKTFWTEDLEWHTDSSGWPRPNDVTALMCIESALTGGNTELLSFATVLEICSRGTNEDLVGAMSEAEFGWALEDALGGGTTLDWILTPDRIRFMRTHFDGLPDGRLRRALSAFASAIDDRAADLSVRLDPGDILMFDNNRCLHRRSTTISDPDLKRLMLRAKIHRYS